MDDLKHLLPPKLFDVVERSGVSTTKQIITYSIWDIKKVTNLNNDDILLLKDIVSEYISPKSITGNELLRQKIKETLPTGCNEINKILNGGFKIGSITELYGESGSGKTQIGLQAAAYNWPNCTAYICTEDRFPIKRFIEIKQGMSDYNPQIDYGSSVFVEHVTESKDLLSCLRVQLPKLLSQKKFSLIVVDSVAAPFRVDTTNYIQRAEDMREFAMTLLHLAQTYNLVILCINQVTSSLDDKIDLPALGLAWSNMVCARLHLKKTEKFVSVKFNSKEIESNVRELSVTFAPNLAANVCTNFVITPQGLQGF